MSGWPRRLFLVGAVLVLAVLVGAPLGMVLGKSVCVNHTLDLLAPFRAIRKGQLAGVFWNSFLLGIYVTAASTVFALPAALLAARTDLGRRKWLDVALLVPFMTPPYIASMGWILFMEKRGYLEQMLPAAHAVTPRFFSLAGMVLIMGLHLFSFLYLILKNAFRRIGSDLEDAGAVSGGGLGYRLRRISLPLVLPSYVMGALLIFIKTISEFGTPATFGRTIGFDVLTWKINTYLSSWPIDMGKATSLASLLLGACLLMWYLHTVVSGAYSFATVGGRSARTRMHLLSGWPKVCAWSYMSLLLALSVGEPYFSVVAASVTRLRGWGLSLGNLTLGNYAHLLGDGSGGGQAFWNSLLLALGAATAALVLGTLVAMVGRPARGILGPLLDFLSLMPGMVPGIIVALGLILFWNSPWMPVRLYNTGTMVILAYVVLFLPYSVQYVKAAAGQLGRSLAEAGRVCGARPAYVFLRILLPLLAPGMLSGWMMTFAVSFRELVASLLLLPPDMQTSATYIYSQFDQGSVSLGMAMALISVALTSLVIFAVNTRTHLR